MKRIDYIFSIATGFMVAILLLIGMNILHHYSANKFNNKEVGYYEYEHILDLYKSKGTPEEIKITINKWMEDGIITNKEYKEYDIINISHIKKQLK